MEVPVPSDWDGETWSCFEIQWPDSPAWTAILAGLITSIQRGPFWRVRTKNEVEAAKLLGRNVVFRNLPFVDCRTCDDEKPDSGGDSVARGDFGSNSACGDSCEEICTMGCVTWLEIEDGILYAYFGPCCKVAIGRMDSLIAGDDIPPVNDQPNEDPEIDQRCRDAWAYAKTVQSFSNELSDMMDSEYDVWNWVTELKSRWPFLKRGDWSIYEFLIEMKVYNAVLDGLGIQYFFTDGETAELACGVLPSLDDISGISQQEFNACLSVLKSQGGVTTGDWASMIVEFVKQECIDPNVRAFDHVTEPECCTEQPPAGAFFEDSFDYDFAHYSPNTNVDYETDMDDVTLRDAQPIALVWEAFGDSSGNGLAKLPEFGQEIIVGSEAAYERTFAYYRNDEGHTYLDLYYPGLAHTQGGDWDTFKNGQFTVNITGNEVQVDGHGTVKLIFKTSDVFGE